MKSRILALGDCNTKGEGPCLYNGYPETFARSRGFEVVNLGHTMATTREAVRIFDDNVDVDAEFITVQFGLVDAWRTIAHAPYVLYYPDNKWRYVGRKLAKKYKKITKKLSLSKWMGEDYLVSRAEYRSNLEHIIHNARGRPVVLLETAPNRELHRNPHIQAYNAVLAALAAEHDHVYLLPLYDVFREHLHDWIQDDGTHLNAQGYAFVSQQLERIYDLYIRPQGSPVE